MSWNQWDHAARYTFLNQLKRPHVNLDTAIAENHAKLVKRGIDPGGPIPDSDTLMAVDQLETLVDAQVEELKAGIQAYDERLAIQAEAVDEGKTTAERAADALERPERFPGEHETARAWLRLYEPPRRIFRKVCA
ncbi:MAG TPA: hypothetical protein VGK48_26975 [Terriglobia bacterium]|jgi:hypothetical protein